MAGQSKYIEIFVREADEHLTSLQGGLLALEKEPDNKGLIHELLRNAHTLKGAARMLGFEEISVIAHGMEDLLKAMEDGDRPVDAAAIDLLLKGTDAVTRLVSALVSGTEAGVDLDQLLRAFAGEELEEEPVVQAEPAQVREDGLGDTVRVKVKTLDSLINRMGELIISRKRFEEKSSQFKELARSAASRELQEFHRALEEDVLYLNYLVQELYLDAMALRMLPLRTITDGFGRMVRDLAREQGKNVDLRIAGDQIELDRILIENLKPVFLHLLRNSVDHGIETVDERLVQGKPARATIGISARYEGNSVRIDVRDDGRGIDPHKVRQIAIAKGLIDKEQAEVMGDEEALYLVFEPGFSTREFITDISGRGVGMDVVKRNIERVKGNLLLRSEVGSHTEITMHLPLTLSVVEALLLLSGAEQFAIPLNYVQETVKLMRGDIVTVGGKEAIHIRGATVPLVSLAELLGLPERKTLLESGRVEAVILKFREQSLACVIDKSLGSSEIVVKGLGEQLKSVRFVSGATILGDGSPALILNVPDLFVHAEGGEAGFGRMLEQGAVRKVKGRVLVVDDSITTRTMERSILITHGYDVEIAVSGEDALAKVRGVQFDLVISDIEMPGINGFELTSRLRGMDAFREVPVIIVSSLSSDADKRRALEVGAQAYIVKGSFEQGTLLDTVEALIG